MIRRICLGTVQFGLDYGVSNTHGKLNKHDVSEILKSAQHAGVACLDTAADYGTCEEALAAHPDVLKHFKIMTKSLKYDPEIMHDFSEVETLYTEALSRSCKTLNREVADVYYLRSPEILFEKYGDRVTDFISRLKENGIIRKVGISVYEESQIKDILKHFTPDVIQIPCNILDQRLIQSGMLSTLKEQQIEIHARSIFMQGLLLMETLPPFFAPIRDHLDMIHKTCIQEDITPLQAALAFILSQDTIDRIILGVSSVAEWQEILEILAKPPETSIDWARLKLDNERYLNPAKWST